jgi:hypothetical protein
MSKQPQVNVRLAPEHHDLIRELAQASESDPAQASSLTLGLADEVADLRVRIALLPEILDRLTRAEKFLEDLTAFAENINDRVKALEQPAGPQTDAPE